MPFQASWPARKKIQRTGTIHPFGRTPVLSVMFSHFGHIETESHGFTFRDDLPQRLMDDLFKNTFAETRSDVAWMLLLPVTVASAGLIEVHWNFPRRNSKPLGGNCSWGRIPKFLVKVLEDRDQNQALVIHRQSEMKSKCCVLTCEVPRISSTTC